MTSSLAESLELVLPALDPLLAPPPVVGRLRRLASRLPPVHRAGFECRLDDTDAQVDLQQGITTEAGEPELLASFVSAGRAASEPSGASAWQALQRLGETWRTPGSRLSGLRDLWFEFDVLEGGAARADDPATLLPSVFGRFRRPDGNGSDSLFAMLDLLADPRHAPVLRETLRRCIAACPAGSYVSHLGVMLGREAAGLRVNISELGLRELPAYLQGVGWPGSIPAVRAMARTLLTFVDSLILCLDAGAAVGPALGLECFFSQKRGRDPRWKPLFRHLEAAGLCAPAKSAAILRWPGELTPLTGEADWPAGLIALGLLEPAHRFGILERRLSHLKLTYSPERPWRAKAYFGFGPIWLQPEATASAAVDSAATPKPPPTADEGLGTEVERAAERAVAFLLAARNQAGFWRDFYGLARPSDLDHRVTGYSSDEWVTAYVATALARGRDPRGSTAAREAWDLLAERRGSGDGWGYHALLPPDSDSTVWALRLAHALGMETTERMRHARRFVLGQLHADGGIACYREADRDQLEEFLGMSGSYAGWCAAHLSISAAAAMLDFGPAPVDYVLVRQQADGWWQDHWWEDDEYATARAVEALLWKGGPLALAAALRGAAWARSRLDRSGAVHSASHGGPSCFATALVLETLVAAVRAGAESSGLKRAIGWLARSQRSDGSFPASARLRVPAPFALDTREAPEQTQVYFDRNAIFTTATALAALNAAYSLESGAFGAE